jgi:hypothetical protein
MLKFLKRKVACLLIAGTTVSLLPGCGADPITSGALILMGLEGARNLQEMHKNSLELDRMQRGPR